MIDMNPSTYLLCLFSDQSTMLGFFFFFQVKPFLISTSFISGNLVFRWTTLPNSSSYDVLITRNNASDVWTRCLNAEYTVKYVLLYDLVRINVKGTALDVENAETYNGLVFFFYIHSQRYLLQHRFFLLNEVSIIGVSLFYFVVAHIIQNRLTVHKNLCQFQTDTCIKLPITPYLATQIEKKILSFVMRDVFIIYFLYSKII